jgi:hypothetical protein
VTAHDFIRFEKYQIVTDVHQDCRILVRLGTRTAASQSRDENMKVPMTLIERVFNRFPFVYGNVSFLCKDRRHLTRAGRRDGLTVLCPTYRRLVCAQNVSVEGSGFILSTSAKEQYAGDKEQME